MMSVRIAVVRVPIKVRQTPVICLNPPPPPPPVVTLTGALGANKKVYIFTGLQNTPSWRQREV